MWSGARLVTTGVAMRVDAVLRVIHAVEHHLTVGHRWCEHGKCFRISHHHRGLRSE